MSNIKEMSEITKERIGNVFETFLGNNLGEKIDEIKNDFNRNNNNYKDKTSRECIEEVCDNVADIGKNISSIRQSVGGRDKSMLIERIISVEDSVQEIDGNVKKIEGSVKEIDGNFEEIDEGVKEIKGLTEQLKNRTEYTEKCVEEAQNKLNTVAQNLESVKDDVVSRLSNINENINKDIKKETEELASQLKNMDGRLDSLKEDITKISEDTISAFADLTKPVSENVTSIKKEIEETAEKVNSVSTDMENLKALSSQNTSVLKEYLDEAILKSEEKLMENNASHIAKISLLMKPLIVLSGINAIGVITAIILMLIG